MRRVGNSFGEVSGPGGAAILIALGLLVGPAPAAVAGPITVIDGDTVERDGERWRLVGLDAPEVHSARCPAERHLGLRAAARLVGLLEARGGRLIGDKREKYGRRLGRGRDPLARRPARRRRKRSHHGDRWEEAAILSNEINANRHDWRPVGG